MAVGWKTCSRVAFLPENHALAIAIMSYNGGLDFGLLGDYDALPDIEVIATGIADALAELLALARGQAPPARARQRRPKTAARPQAARATNGNRQSDNGGKSSNGGGAGGRPARILPEAQGRSSHGPAADMRRAKRQRGRQHQARKNTES